MRLNDPHPEPIAPGAAPLDVALLCAPEPPAAPGDAWRARLRAEVYAIRRDTRRIKALLLYGDRVTVVGSPLALPYRNSSFYLPLWVSAQRTYSRDAKQEPVPDRQFWADVDQAKTDADLVDAVARVWPEKREEAVEAFGAVRGASELLAAGERGLLRTAEELAPETPGFAPLLEKMHSGHTSFESNPLDKLYGYWVSWALTTPTVIPVGAPPRDAGSCHPLIEGALAGAVLGELNAFPDADIDVLLDVRGRLAGPRVRLRAALSVAAAEIAEVSGVRAIQTAIVDVRRRLIDPSLAEMSEALDDLRVRTTLLRLAQNKAFNAAVGATVVLAVAATQGPSNSAQPPTPCSAPKLRRSLQVKSHSDASAAMNSFRRPCTFRG